MIVYELGQGSRFRYDAGCSYDNCWHGSPPQPLLKVRHVGGATMSRLQRMLKIATTRRFRVFPVHSL